MHVSVCEHACARVCVLHSVILLNRVSGREHSAVCLGVGCGVDTAIFISRPDDYLLADIDTGVSVVQD